MFAITHTYIANKVMDRQSNLLAFGSALPDIRLWCKGGLGLERIHQEPEEIPYYY